MKNYSIVLLCVLVGGLAYGQTPAPRNLQAELLGGGDVSLTWDAPAAGLAEDFEDGIADDFDYYPDANSFTVQDGYLKMLTGGSWQCAWYTGQEFTEFDLEATFENVSSNNSRGVQFRGDGPRDADYNGYNFYVAYNSVSYSFYKYINGASSLVINWTTSEFINTEPGETNTLRVVGSGSNFDFYINGNYVNSGTDASHPSGIVGAIGSGSVVAWYDYINCEPTAVLQPARAEYVGNSPSVSCDEFGHPKGEPMLDTFQPTSPGERASRELDEFIEYIVYRNDSPIGTSVTESYTDDLPSFGDHTYTVTALYDEGESAPSNEAVVTYDPATLDLIGQITELPAEGGLIYYDGHLVNNTAQTFNNVDYWVAVTLPNGQEFEPVERRRVTVPAFVDVTVTALSLEVSPVSPEGEYLFVGKLGYYPNAQLSDSFTFTKEAPIVGGVDVDPTQWATGGTWIAGETEGFVEVPVEYVLTEAFPNPFNPSTSFSVVLPNAADLTVTVFNIAGQQVATVANSKFSAGQHNFSFDASDMASGLYFIRANVAGEFDQIRKVTLIR
jgi:Secretion system C-terminal sorting domain/3-keto-disaccharide hydrolase